MKVAAQPMEKDRFATPFRMKNPVVPEVPDPVVSTDEDNEEELDNEKANNGVEIKRPGDHDVLLGRGGGTNNHTGNVNFRQLVHENKLKYLSASKVDKPKVARDVVIMWKKQGGRFLQRRDENAKGAGSVKDEETIWVEVNEKQARAKASQCLRERTPDVLPYLSQWRQHQDKLTEQGVSMVQQHMQHQAYENGGRNSMMNMPDRPMSTNASLNLRRGSLPAANLVSPQHGMMQSQMQQAMRRGSLPAVMHGTGMVCNTQTMEMQEIMARQQRVLQDAYTAIERGNRQQQLMQRNFELMQHQQRLLAERNAMLQQQYVDFDVSLQQPYHLVSPPPARNLNFAEQIPSTPSNPPSFTRHHTTGHMPPSDIHVPQQVRVSDLMLEPLPFDDGGRYGDADEYAGQYQDAESEIASLGMLPDAPKSTPLGLESRKGNGAKKSVAANSSGDVPTVDESNGYTRSPTNTQKGTATTTTKSGEHELTANTKRNPTTGPKKSAMKTGASTAAEGTTVPPQGHNKAALLEYRKTLEDFITNHQVAAPTEIDDENSEDDSAVDNAEWLEECLNDEADAAQAQKKGRPSMTNHRENSKKSLMSTGTTSYMSLALSDMEQSAEEEDLKFDDGNGRRLSATRSLTSNQSVMFELTDFDDLDVGL